MELISHVNGAPLCVCVCVPGPRVGLIAAGQVSGSCAMASGGRENRTLPRASVA